MDIGVPPVMPYWIHCNNKGEFKSALNRRSMGSQQWKGLKPYKSSQRSTWPLCESAVIGPPFLKMSQSIIGVGTSFTTLAIVGYSHSKLFEYLAWGLFPRFLVFNHLNSDSYSYRTNRTSKSPTSKTRRNSRFDIASSSGTVKKERRSEHEIPASKGRYPAPDSTGRYPAPDSTRGQATGENGMSREANRKSAYHTAFSIMEVRALWKTIF